MKHAERCFLVSSKTGAGITDTDVLLITMSLKQKFPHLNLLLQVRSPETKATALARGVHSVVCEQELRMVLCETNCLTYTQAICATNMLYPGFSTIVLNLLHCEDKGGKSKHGNDWIREYCLYPFGEYTNQEAAGLGKELYFVKLKDFVGTTFYETSYVCNTN